jgi:hypothetical protein
MLSFVISPFRIFANLDILYYIAQSNFCLDGLGKTLAKRRPGTPCVPGLFHFFREGQFPPQPLQFPEQLPLDGQPMQVFPALTDL